MGAQWTEIQELKVGDRIVIRRQGIAVEKVAVKGERVTLTGATEDGHTVVYVGGLGESIQRQTARQMAVV